MIRFTLAAAGASLSLLLLLIPACSAPAHAAAENYRCAPTRPDGEGPFYRKGAPVRDEVGEGYLLTGTVKSARDCRPLAGAKIEVWLNGPEGKYGDDWWATLYSDANGNYRFESHVPVNFGSRPPHIHMVVNADGYRELITQHYPLKGAAKAVFDLVLIPATPATGVKP